MMKMAIDTNIIIRLLTGDDIEQSPVAKALFEKWDECGYRVVIYGIVVCECVYVLRRYGYNKNQIKSSLLHLFEADGVEVEDSEAMKRALHQFSDRNVDISDAWIACKASEQQVPIVTWNAKDFKKLDCEFYLPEQLLGTT